MKTGKLLLMAGLAFAAVSCNNDEGTDVNPSSNYLQFSANIGNMSTSSFKTKASGSSWDADDAIGIYMKSSGETLGDASIINDAANVKYTTSTGDGNFVAAATGVNFPTDGAAVDFIAYYPYDAEVANASCAISVADQSNLAAIDFLYSNNATAANNASESVNLNFQHQLAQFNLNVSSGNGVADISELSIEITGMQTAATISLADGTVSATGNRTAVSTSITSASSTAVTANAILIPGDNLANATVSFYLKGNLFGTWQPTTEDMTLESGKRYTYEIKLQAAGAVVAVLPVATIQDWTETVLGSTVVEGNIDEELPLFELNEETPYTTNGKTVTFNFTENAKTIAVFTGDEGNDYANKDGKTVVADALNFSFTSSWTYTSKNGGEGIQTPTEHMQILVSTDYSGEGTATSLYAASWTDVTNSFSFPTVTDETSLTLGSNFSTPITADGEIVDLVSYFESSETMYIAYKYTVLNQNENGGYSTVNFSPSTIAYLQNEKGISTSYEAGDFDWGTKIDFYSDDYTTLNRISVTASNVMFRGSLSTNLDKQTEAWVVTPAISKSFYSAAHADEALVVKAESDETAMTSYEYTYTTAGEYNVYFVVSDAEGTKTVVETTVTVTE